MGGQVEGRLGLMPFRERSLWWMLRGPLPNASLGVGYGLVHCRKSIGPTN